MTDLSVEYRLELTKVLQGQRIALTCVTCEHFEDKHLICKLAGRQPPVEIIASGCIEWSEGLPF